MKFTHLWPARLGAWACSGAYAQTRPRSAFVFCLAPSAMGRALDLYEHNQGRFGRRKRNWRDAVETVFVRERGRGPRIPKRVMTQMALEMSGGTDSDL